MFRRALYAINSSNNKVLTFLREKEPKTPLKNQFPLLQASKRKRAGVNSCNPNEPLMSSGVDLTKCACYPASSCTMQDKDATASHHRCTLCKRHYFAICMPDLEFNMEMTCRFCIVEKVSVIISNCALVLMLPNSVGCRCCTHFCQTKVSDN
jgi:hypothetical protein